MNNNEVQIVVTSQDKSRPGLDSAKRGMADVKTQAENTSKSMSESSRRSTSETETHFKRMSGAVGVAMAGVGVAIATKAGEALKDFVGDSIKAASDLSESMNAVKVTFGQQAVVVQDWGEKNAASFGLSKRAFNEYATPLGAMLKNAGLSMQDTTKWTIDLTKRAADMASVFNTDVGSALEAIQAGLRGEQDPLERYGVSLSAAKVEAEAMAETHKKAASELTDTEKATARLNIIMKQTEQTSGDFKNTSDGLANSQRKLAADVENAKASIGEHLTPIMAQATIGAANLLDTVSNLGERINLPGQKSSMFENLKGNADDIKALDDRLSALVHAGAARQAADQMMELSDKAREAGLSAEDLGALFPKYGQALSDVAKQHSAAATSGQKVVKTMEQLREEATKTADALLGQRDSMRELEASYDDATDSIKKNGRTLDIGSEKGRANQEALDGIASAAKAAAKAVADGGGSQSQVNKIMSTAAARFEATAVKMGMSRSAAHKLAGELLGIPKNTNANVNVNTGTASARLAALRAQLFSVRGLLADVNAGTYGHGLGVYKATGGIVGRAATGGIRSNRVMVGEHGPEVMDLPPGTQVHSNPDSERMLGGAMGGTVNVRLEVDGRGGDDFGRFIAEMIRRYVRVSGGNVQQALGRD